MNATLPDPWPAARFFNPGSRSYHWRC
jgi:hypothetical protein